MAKPPTNADPRRFIIGRGIYDNFQVARPYCDEHVFRIDPTPVPFGTIVIYNLMFIVFFIGFALIAKNFADADPILAYVAPICVGGVTCLAFTVIAYYRFSSEVHRGPWLIYDKSSKHVELPREGRVFHRNEIVHLQYITTKNLKRGRVINNDRTSELNLITSDGTDRHRWPLLRSIFTSKAFDSILRPLMQETDLPVVRVVDQWLGWKVTEEPYHFQR